MQKVNKSEITRIFQHTWYLYPVAIVVTSLGFIWSFSIYHQPTDYERLTIFVGAGQKEQSFDTLLKNRFDNVRQVEINSISPSNQLYAQKLNVYLNNADLIILPEYTLEQFKDYCDGFFYQNTDYVKSYLSTEETFYQDNGNDYGVRVREKNTSSWMENYYYLENNVDYYVLISVSSKNAGLLTNEDNANNDNALKAMSYILEGF